tara:strand:- start:1225 stop:1452 length:228 start_codon:yes stop_codon:yes gene_type:complete
VGKIETTEDSNKDLRSAIKAVRETGAVNMMDKGGVARILSQLASECQDTAFLVAAARVSTMSGGDYMKLLMSLGR